MEPSGPFTLTIEETSYLENWMNRVSRSFAVVVAALGEPLRTTLSAAYIICRVVDNVEDGTAPIDWKKARFAEIAQMLDEPGRAPLILKTWDNEPWAGLTEDERNLMSSTSCLPLWRIFAQFPKETRSIIGYWVNQMVEGMSHLADEDFPPRFKKRNDIEVLAGYQDYGRYCDIVAGTVGNMATGLVISHYHLPGDVADQLFIASQSCGRGLQKTNIIKDFCEDISRGICYLPDEWLSEVNYTPLSLSGASTDWTRKVLFDVMADLKEATRYVLTLPYEAVGYRIASLLCLLPALQTILLAAQNQVNLFTARHPTKIDHQTFAQCIQDSRRLLNHNEEIQDYYQQVVNQMNQALMGCSA